MGILYLYLLKFKEYRLTLNFVAPIASYSTLQTGMVQAQKSIEKVAESIATGVNTQISPADSYVASGLNSDIRAANKAIENAQTGYNFTSIADSTLANISENLNRIRELSIQACNGTYSDEQLAVFQNEIDQNVEQIKQTFNNATFNGKTTIHPVTPDSPQPVANVDFFIDPASSKSVSYNPNIAMDSFNFDVTTPDAASNSINQVDSMLNEINIKRAEIGTVQSNFENAIEQQTNGMLNSASALSSIQDTDYVSAIAELKKSSFSMELMAKVMKTVMNSERYVLDLLN